MVPRTAPISVNDEAQLPEKSATHATDRSFILKWVSPITNVGTEADDAYRQQQRPEDKVTFIDKPRNTTSVFRILCWRSFSQT